MNRAEHEETREKLEIRNDVIGVVVFVTSPC
jgi:hypothetical protein